MLWCAVKKRANKGSRCNLVFLVWKLENRDSRVLPVRTALCKVGAPQAVLPQRPCYRKCQSFNRYRNLD